MTLSTQWVIKWIEGCNEEMVKNRDLLIELDRAIGDGDHGENMVRGFSAVAQKLEGPTYDSPSAVLKMVASTLLSTVGGASGPLFGTAFLRCAKAIENKELDAKTLVQMFQEATEGIKARGKAVEKEKTMVDSWSAATRAATKAQKEGKDEIEVLKAAAAAAEEGAKSTIDMIATKGRASYLGDRSVGHEDPGACSSALIISQAMKAAMA